MGAQSVIDALELPVTRIGHDVRAIEDRRAMDLLLERGTVLEVCPSSNLRLGLSSSISAHPLRALHDHGVRCTLNSDDPAVFDTTLAREHDLVRGALGFSHGELRCSRARRSMRPSWTSARAPGSFAVPQKARLTPRSKPVDEASGRAPDEAGSDALRRHRRKAC